LRAVPAFFEAHRKCLAGFTHVWQPSQCFLHCARRFPLLSSATQQVSLQGALPYSLHPLAVNKMSLQICVIEGLKNPIFIIVTLQCVPHALPNPISICAQGSLWCIRTSGCLFCCPHIQVVESEVQILPWAGVGCCLSGSPAPGV
jgi:hypothetical protein